MSGSPLLGATLRSPPACPEIFCKNAEFLSSMFFHIIIVVRIDRPSRIGQVYGVEIAFDYYYSGLDLALEPSYYLARAVDWVDWHAYIR